MQGFEIVVSVKQVEKNQYTFEISVTTSLLKLFHSNDPDTIKRSILKVK